MADLVVRVGCKTAQGRRPNNEDAYLVDLRQGLFVVADGMGGQDRGEVASGMAVDLLPRLVHQSLENGGDAPTAVMKAFEGASTAIHDASKHQPEGRRMGTTAVLALCRNGKVYVSHLGDSRAYLVRGHTVRQLTVDHSVAQALVDMGALTAEEAKSSPYQNVLHKFLGCATMTEGAQVHPFSPEANDRLLLASDGLTNFLSDDDLRTGPTNFPDPQDWTDHLVQMALDRGSRDNVTCIVVRFDAVD